MTILKLKVSTKKPKFKIEFDKLNETLLIEIKSIPKKGNANKEIVKELKKYFKKEVKINSGLKNKEKIVEIDLDKESIINLILQQHK
jgi:uncharacterized protein